MEEHGNFAEFTFSKMKLAIHCEGKTLPKRNLFKGRDYRRLLEKVECREQRLLRIQKDNQIKAENVAANIVWERAFQMATGSKIKDNVQLLMKSLKKKETDKEKRKKKWICRKQAVNERRERTIQRRQQNLMDRTNSKRKKIKRKH